MRTLIWNLLSGDLKLNPFIPAKLMNNCAEFRSWCGPICNTLQRSRGGVASQSAFISASPAARFFHTHQFLQHFV